MMENLISLIDAAKAGIDRVRLPIWRHPMDHIKIDIIAGRPGPWLHLFCPFNVECNGKDPVDMSIFQHNVNAKEWAAYQGPHPDSKEYLAAVDAYKPENMPIKIVQTGPTSLEVYNPMDSSRG